MRITASSHDHPQAYELVINALVAYAVFDGFSHGLFDVRPTSFISASVLAVLVAVAMLMASTDYRERVILTVGPLHYVLAGFVAYIAVSSLFFGGTFDLSFVKNLLLFVAVGAVAVRVSGLKWVLAAGALAGVVQAGAGLMQVLQHSGVPQMGLTGALDNHVQYAFFLLLSVACLWPFVATTSGWRRGGLVLVALVQIGIVVASGARGVFIVAGACGVLWALLSTQNTRSRSIRLAGITIVSVGAVFASGRLRTLALLVSMTDDSLALNQLLSGRLPLLESAWRMFVENPLFGVGYGNYSTLWPLYAPAWTPYTWLTIRFAAHSTYLQILAELGLVGGILYLLILVLGGTYAVQTIRAQGALILARADASAIELDRARFLRATGTAVLVGLVAIALHGILDNSGWHDRVFYVFLGLAAALRASSTILGHADGELPVPNQAENR